MVGGPIVDGQEDYSHYPFNLATQGHRQPGSSFKPFTLAMALQYGGYGPSSVIDSAPQDFIVPNSGGKEHFIVHNFGNTYSGSITLSAATDLQADLLVMGGYTHGPIRQRVFGGVTRHVLKHASVPVLMVH